jgi:hypothetical protein
MIALCRAVIEPDDAGRYLAEALDEWLVGELRLVRNLKDALIGQKITRLNARHMLASLARWLRLCDRGGLVLVLDVTRCLDDRAAGGGLAYTAAALLDVYEALRQFIDGADGVDGSLVVVVADERFLTDDRRGVHRYDALKSRIWDDVRDRARANPLACLLRVTP